MGPMIGRRAVAAALAWLIAGCTGALQTAAPTASPTPGPTTATVQAEFDVGGRKMHLYCVGPIDPARPTVIFEGGLEDLGAEWNNVLTELGGSTRACVYDRAGRGKSRQSDPAEVGRTTTDQVADLHRLLAAASVPPPYLLVGFSLGGWNVMVFHDLYPTEVSGVVMVDVRPPAFTQRSADALPPESPTESADIKFIRHEAPAFELDPTLNDEGLLLAESALEAIATDDFGDLPLLVLAAADITENYTELDTGLSATLQGIWWELQDDLVERSTVGRLIKVDNTSHDIPFERPDAVVAAMRELLGT